MTLKELLEGRFGWSRNLKQGAGRGTEETFEEECPSCHARFREGTRAEALRICPSCGARLAMPPMERISMIADCSGTWAEHRWVVWVHRWEVSDLVAKDSKEASSRKISRTPRSNRIRMENVNTVNLNRLAVFLLFQFGTLE